MKKYLLLIVLLFISCGARKSQVNITNVKKDSLVEASTKVVTDIVETKKDTTSIKTIIEDDEITITPIDTSKSFVVDGKTFKNVVIKQSKKKITSSYNNNKTELNTRHIDSSSISKIETKESIRTKTKKVDVKQNYWSLFWLILIILILYLLWQNKHRLFNLL